MTVCPALADGAPAATNPPTSRRRARAVLVPATSARAGTARRLHRLGGASALTLLLATDDHWISDVPHVLAQRAEPPSVFASYGDRGIRFTHTEVSDRKIADLLTSTKNSPVIYVLQLAEAPPAATWEVYIFSNGIQPEQRGPLGVQGDVFPTAPGDAQYSPCGRWSW